jgi:hypothetical protein
VEFEGGDEEEEFKEADIPVNLNDIQLNLTGASHRSDQPKSEVVAAAAPLSLNPSGNREITFQRDPNYPG